MVSRVQAAGDRYILYPKDDASISDRQQFTETLNDVAPQGNVYTSVRGQEIRFWCADLTLRTRSILYGKPICHATVDQYHRIKEVMRPFTHNELSGKNGTYHFGPTSEMTPSNLSASGGSISYGTQKSPVAAELRALSQPLNSGTISNYPNYVYPIGETPTYIYHVELGIFQQHQEFHGRKIEWLWTGLANATDANTTTEAAVEAERYKGHSTCTASKAVGKLYGVSKSARLVVVKMPTYEEDSVYEVLDTVIDDIIEKEWNETSVVSVSWGAHEPYTHTSATDPLKIKLLAQINQLGEMHVPFVCAAGNDALYADRGKARLIIDTFPAVVTTFYPRRRLFMAVGNSDINGARDMTSQISGTDETQIYAPGVDIKCASSTSSTEFRTDTGTSFCKSPL